jgi:predicted DNA-binding protein with PD1-like motif
MKSLPLRFGPGIDLRAALQGVLAQHAVQAAYVIQGIGSLGPGCTVRTTAEVLVALLHDYRFTRDLDALTGFPELAIALRRSDS